MGKHQSRHPERRRRDDWRRHQFRRDISEHLDRCLYDHQQQRHRNWNVGILGDHEPGHVDKDRGNGNVDDLGGDSQHRHDPSFLGHARPDESGFGHGADTISGAWTLEFDSSAALGQTIGFTGIGGTLFLAAPGSFSSSTSNSATISGFDTRGSADTIKVAGPWTFSGVTENGAGTSGSRASPTAETIYIDARGQLHAGELPRCRYRGEDAHHLRLSGTRAEPGVAPFSGAVKIAPFYSINSSNSANNDGEDRSVRRWFVSRPNECGHMRAAARAPRSPAPPNRSPKRASCERLRILGGR
jgi:hypothetical protein